MTESKIVTPNQMNYVDDRDDTDQVHPVTKRQGATPFMVAFSFFIALSSWACNFDIGYGGIVLLMPAYNRAFGVCRMTPNAVTGVMMETCAVTATQQSLISLTSLALAAGGVIAGVVGNYFGRRGTIQSGCTLVIIGAAGMLGTSGNFAAYMVCKCIGGLGLGQLYAACPIYGVECTAAHRRGMLMALYNVGLACGNAAAAAVCLASSSYTSNLAWQIPIICQIPVALILGFGILLFPESPRWLLVKGKEDMARKSFGKFYGKDPQSDEITAQIHEVQQHIEMERFSGSTTSWTDIFRKGDLRRTATSVLISLGLALTGIHFVVPYSVIFLESVGISSPFLINVIVAACIFAGAFLGPTIIEYGGRRFAMLVGYSGMASCMLIFAAVSSGLGRSSAIAKNVLIAFLCIWAFIFGACIGTSVWVSAAEQHSVRLRTYGHAATTMFYNIFSFAAAFYTPYMLNANYGNMGTNIGYFYFAVTTVMAALVFFFVPETAQLTLEEIDDYYASGRPAWKTSTRRNNRIANGEIRQDRPIGDKLDVE